ncbi:phage tail terminator protein [Pararhizobium gei]|uniref:phage tail terminator protein n=1 Tax=Pararhizobium gei TaxID=1395951 RepID=UPI0023DB64AD|nr:hypothetical protein [Rhizobium gei]
MIALIVDRLKTEAPALPFVDMAEDLDAIFKGTAPGDGYTYVVPFREKGTANKVATGGFMQVVGFQFLVAFVLRRHDDAKGGLRALQFDAIKGDIQNALAGWEPTEHSIPIELVGGEGTPIGNNITIYVQTWETTYLLTGA